MGKKLPFTQQNRAAVERIEQLFKRVRADEKHRKGHGNESYALSLLRELQNEERVNFVIDTYITVKHSGLDEQGIDIVVISDRGNLFLQIKSSQFGIQMFKKKRPNCGIPYILVTRDSSKERIKRDIKNALLHQYKNLPAGTSP